jgi:hypothetical protein
MPQVGGDPTAVCESVCAWHALTLRGNATAESGMKPSMRALRSRWKLLSCGALLGVFAALLAITLVAIRHEGRVVDARVRPSHGVPSQAAEERAPSAGLHAALLGLPRTADADVYVKSITRIVFGPDSRNFGPADYRRLLRSEADPNLTESGRADLFATIDSRIPSEQLWNRMRRNEQWSKWSSTRTWEPAAWSQVVTGGYAEPGWVMRNVTGTQTTHYVEATGVARTITRELTLSVVMRCPVPGSHVQRCALVLISTTPVF